MLGQLQNCIFERFNGFGSNGLGTMMFEALLSID